MIYDERAQLVEHLAYNPTAGTVIPSTGGIRKMRWGLEGRGKRGGARVIYFFHNLEMPLFLLTAYAKNEREDLSHADYASFQQLTRMLVSSYQIWRLEATTTARSSIADSIRRGLAEAVAYAEGTADESLYRVHIPAKLDVKAIRSRLKMTQQQFAARFGFNITTLRHWEQGRRAPEGPTRAYLLVIDRDPDAVQKALRIA